MLPCSFDSLMIVLCLQGLQTLRWVTPTALLSLHLASDLIGFDENLDIFRYFPVRRMLFRLVLVGS